MHKMTYQLVGILAIAINIEVCCVRIRRLAAIINVNSITQSDNGVIGTIGQDQIRLAP